jgi:hypothetical protein
LDAELFPEAFGGAGHDGLDRDREDPEGLGARVENAGELVGIGGILGELPGLLLDEVLIGARDDVPDRAEGGLELHGEHVLVVASDRV